MSVTSFSTAILLACLVSGSLCAQDDDAAIRIAVERSLPGLVKNSVTWKAKAFGPKQVRCVSCHHLPMTVWAHQEAAARGLKTDQTKIGMLTDNVLIDPCLVNYLAVSVLLFGRMIVRVEIGSAGR
jgi:hypothetical protein